ncbi:MAG: hypothetical protein CVV41_18195 [Candidatus Riflebacteria bacterium HGW-Riflebacteria-1]|jgi:hypothetical protein|nr:MAG: hypothetical protein CVV41_18195 [Candidatus Riflebacteria bacterium HGW-Riflebacteria-1]
MKRFWILCFALVTLFGFSDRVWALRLEGEAISAKIVAVEEQNGKMVEVTYNVTVVDSAGYIQGQVAGAAGGSSDYRFGDIKTIVNDEANHVYLVTFHDGKVLKLASARMVTNYSSTLFNCKVSDGTTETEVRLDSGTFKSVEFVLPESSTEKH